MANLTNRFRVAVHMLSNRSQMTSNKCGKNLRTSVIHWPAARIPLLFLPHFGIFCDLLLNRPDATWNNLFVLENEQKEGGRVTD